MNMFMHLRLTAAIFLTLLLAHPSHAESSKNYAAMALASWSAFECSALAGQIKNAGEQERLFRYGYDKGKKFIEAVKANEASREDILKDAPVGVLWRLQGPTADFILGRIYSAAEDEALDDVLKKDPQNMNSDEVQKILVENKFRKQNCSLIGK